MLAMDDRHPGASQADYASLSRSCIHFRRAVFDGHRPRRDRPAVTASAIAAPQSLSPSRATPAAEPHRTWAQREGASLPLGATWIADERAYNFALYSKHAERVVLLAFRDDDA